MTVQYISETTLVDPVPLFIPQWSNAIKLADSLDLASYLETDQHKYEAYDIVDADKRVKFIQDAIDHQFSSASCCLVGEAHCYTDRYSDDDEEDEECEFCEKMCIQPAFSALIHGGDTLIRFKVKLWNHMVKRHGERGKHVSHIPKIRSLQK